MALSDIGEALAYEAAFAMQAFEDPSYPLSELGELGIDLHKKLRSLAIIQLLVNADSDGFHHNLIRSGRIRLAYLERLRQDGVMHHHAASGRYEPVLDLIAAGQFDMAHAIGRLSPADWQRGHEYEDDYCYAQMLFRLVPDANGTPVMDDLAARFVAALEGAPDARLDLCLTLSGKDQDAFTKAFEALLQHRSATIAADKARSETITPEVTAMRQVYVEGLAMLQLAAARGLRTESEYLYCPSLARVPMATRFTE